MKILKVLIAGMIVIMSACSTNAQSVSDIIGKVTKNSGSSSTAGNIINGLIEGVFTKSDLNLSDLTGNYQANGPAVTFKSENLLKKAGGIAAASAIESKVNPYYEQYGLNNMTLSIDENSNFTMKVKSLPLKGTITKNENDGTFDFNFNIVGIKLGKFTAYIEKTGSNLNLMFDANKLKSLISTIAKLTGNSMATTLGSLLDSYDGLCIGWKMVSINTAPSSESQSTTKTTEETPENSTSNNSATSSSAVSKGLNALKNILNKGN